MGQIEEARKGNITPEAEAVAKAEGLSPEYIAEEVAKGTIVIPENRLHKFSKICGIGKGLLTKTNANIGTSPDLAELEFELKKLDIAKKCGVDTVMDLSTGGDLKSIRKKITEAADMPVGTVPIYQTAVEITNSGRKISDMTPDQLFKTIEEHGKEGIDFITVHCGVTLDSVERLKREGRVMDVISRGGAFLVNWMLENEKQNPLYSQYDRLLEIAARYDLTLSLGDGMRPGCLADATDRAQIQELILIGELAQRALEAGVQAMIEGPGHIPLNQIQENVKLEKELCHDAPFFVLGPIVTDIAPGYDHITAAIGGAIAASFGADFLCYVTPAEHLRLPTLEDVREGVIAARIAAHAADLAKGIKSAHQLDLEMGKRRKKRNWAGQIELAIDPEKAREYHKTSVSKFADACTMCSEYCSLRLLDKKLNRKR